MIVALAELDLRVYGCSSLKEKRHVVKSLSAALRSRFNVAVAEVGHQDLWQRASLGVSAVAGEGYHVKKVMHEVERFVDRQPAVEIIQARLTLHGPDD